MKKMRRQLTTGAIAMVMALSLAACGGKKTETVAETAPEKIVIQTETETETVVETEAANTLPEGMMYSYLTGEAVNKEIGTKRPYAIMINNVPDALPQSGVGQAEMIYEAEVEAGITRLLAVFQDVDGVEKIGSIRSARHNYIDFANDNEAVYVHYGQSNLAQDRIDREGIVTIHGLSGYESSVFYRSSDRSAPHNVYTTGEMLAAGLEITGLTRDYPEGYTSRLLFNEEDITPENGVDAVQINIPFDSRPYFTYNTEDGLYYRYQYGEAHIDREDGSQLAFKNIIVQYESQSTVDSAGHQDLILNGTGNGLYISDGKVVNITWSRADDSDKTRYYDEAGNPISLNPGKTIFEVVPDSKAVTYE